MKILKVFAALYLSFTICTNLFGQRYAMLVGVNDSNYDGLKKLRHARRETKEIGDILANNGWQIDLLTNSAASKDAITERLEFYANNLFPRSTFLFYFSGHGIDIKSLLKSFTMEKFEMESCYPQALIAVNKGSGCNLGLVPFQQNPDEGADILLGDELLKYLSKCESKEIIVIIDACYSGNYNEIRKMSLEYSSLKLNTGFHSLTGVARTTDGLISGFLIKALNGATSSGHTIPKSKTDLTFYDAAVYVSKSVVEVKTKEGDDIYNVRFMIAASEPLNLVKIQGE